MKDIFEELREKVDALVGNSFRDVPAAVPYLKKLFTEEYARVYIAMEDRLQPVEEVAERLGRSGDEVRPVLDEMADKGLVMTTTKIDPVFYAPFPFLTGFGDWTAYYEDVETAQAMLEYMQQFDSQVRGRETLAFRTLPIYETIPDKTTVAPYDDIRKVIENAKSISVANCYCDLHLKKVGAPITEPLERCFIFGMWADYLIEKGYGRRVSPEEALQILDKCKEAGLVQNASDMLNPVFVCNCPEYCGSNLLRKALPARIHNYFAAVDTDLCSGCETCIDLCPVKAISMSSENIATVDQNVCISCGVCVTKCPTEALSLKKRSESEHYVPKLTHPQIRSSEEYEEDLKRYSNIIKRKD